MVNHFGDRTTPAERFYPDFLNSLDYLKSLLKDDLLSMNIVYTGHQKSIGETHLINYKSQKNNF